MLEYSMHKILYFYILQAVLVSSLHAKEPILSILFDITSNGSQKFNIGNYNFRCNSYAIETIEELYYRDETSSECKKSIENFYTKNPKLKYFSEYLLHVKQEYHVDFRNSECILYAKGEKTLSEILLENGLGILNKPFKDREFEYSFKKAQHKATINKIGLWGDKKLRSCFEAKKN